MSLLRLRVASTEISRKAVTALIRRSPGSAKRLAEQAERLAIGTRILLARQGVLNEGAGLSGGAIDSGFVADLASIPPEQIGPEIIRLLDRRGMLTDQLFFFLLTRLFANRNLGLLRAIVADENFGRPAVRGFYAARLAQHRGEPGPPFDALMALLEAPDQLVPPAEIIKLIVERYVRDEDGAGLEAFLDRYRSIAQAALNDTIALGCLRTLMRSGRITFARSFLLERLGRLSGVGQLYYLEALDRLAPEELTRQGLGPPVRWRQVAAELKMRTRGRADGALIERSAIAPLERLPAADPNFLDIRFDQAAAKVLLDRIGERISAREPCSLLRLGDGEAYAFSHAPVLDLASRDTFEDDDRLRERHWWGALLDERRSGQIKAEVRTAVSRCDILAIPSIYRIIRDVSPNTERFGTVIGQRGLALVFAHLGCQIPIAGKLLTEERCHQILFTPDKLRSLCAMAQRVVLISCWRADQLSGVLDGDIHSIVIPPHTKVVHATDPHDLPLPMIYERTVEEIGRVAGPGVLVIVGAGLIGKIFVDAARSAGGVALDVGSVLDYAAGYKTRSLADIV